MKKDIEIEKYRFIGDSSVDKVICMRADGSTMDCTQTDFISALAKSKKHIKSGRKIKLNDNSGKVSYLIDYGNDENEPKQMIKVTMDEENIVKGDVNALAVDSICQHSITIGKNNIKKKVLSGVAMTLATVSLAGALVGGFAYASEKDAEYEAKKTESYVSQLNEERRQKGLNDLTFGDNTNASQIDYENLIIDDDSITSGRSK